MTCLSDLPAELLSGVLSYLPIKSLLNFASTSSNNHSFALSCLQTIDIGIHPSRHAAVLSEPQHCCMPKVDVEEQPSGRTKIILPQKRCKSLFITIYHQNEVAAELLKAHGSCLRTLDLSIWDLRMETATAISKANRLRHLTLRMDHPHTRVKNMPGLFWYTSPGSTVWNKFYAAPSHFYPLTPPASPRSSRCSSPEPKMVKPVFGQLETLHLERAGITDFQLQQIINENPNLKEIRLRKCFNLTDEFFRNLANSDLCSPVKVTEKRGLKVLHFEMSSNPLVDSRVLQYVSSMSGLKSLSFSGCSNLQNQLVKDMNEDEWMIPDLTPPQAEEWNDDEIIEIDPSYND